MLVRPYSFGNPAAMAPSTAWPATNLLGAWDQENQAPASGAFTSWPSTAGSTGGTLTKGGAGTLTNSASGVALTAGSAWLDLPTDLTLTGVFTIYVVCAKIVSTNFPVIGAAAGNSTTIIPFSDGNTYINNAAGVGPTLTFNPSGTILMRFRRAADNTIYGAATGVAETSNGVQAGNFVVEEFFGRSGASQYSTSASNFLKAEAVYAEDTVAAGTATAIQARINTVYGVTL